MLIHNLPNLESSAETDWGGIHTPLVYLRVKGMPIRIVAFIAAFNRSTNY